MKKLVALVLSTFLLLLSSCSFTSPVDEASTSMPTSTPAPTVTPTSTPTPDFLDVFLNIEALGEDGKPEFSIQTNLPDGTVLSVEFSINDPPDDVAEDIFEQLTLTVRNGQASTQPFTNDGKPLVGQYTFYISVFPGSQPEQIQAIIGSDGEFLDGDLVTDTGSYKFITTSCVYNSPIEDLTLSLNEVLAGIETALVSGFGDNYDMTADDNTITANVWTDGVALVATLALSGNEESLEAWDSLVESTRLASERCQALLNDNGYGDMVFLMQILNDSNKENTLASTSMGLVFYDCVNGTDLTGGSSR